MKIYLFLSAFFSVWNTNLINNNFKNKLTKKKILKNLIINFKLIINISKWSALDNNNKCEYFVLSNKSKINKQKNTNKYYFFHENKWENNKREKKTNFFNRKNKIKNGNMMRQI